ncbi:MAG: PAS domain-containing sensor histidine kinase [Betaproteobacteria bacterium]|nr:PAS domain-containing sensor histidine kinase [Betaproteobacteria bacterium]
MSGGIGLAAGGEFSETHWNSFRYLNLYRFVLAGLLFVASVGVAPENSFFLAEFSRLHISVSALYLLLTGIAVMPLHRYRHHFNLQLSAYILLDIGVFTALMYAGGGSRSGFGALLLVSLAGAGLVGQGRLVLFYAAVATIAILVTEVFWALRSGFEHPAFMQAGLLSIGFFATAISARLLAKRVLANEELAKQRGIALANQTLVSQRVIEEMQDGVLLVSQEARVLQHNPRAERMLGLRAVADGPLATYSTELAESFAAWQSGGAAEPEPFQIAASGLTLRARFVVTESSDRAVLVFLEDMGRVQERAQQLKLAALGRLTANIAHEIRNPLSAISHAGELLLEERRGETQERLVRIVRDNTLRLDRIVRDVLELGRRDRVHRESVDMAVFLPVFLEEFCVKEKLDGSIVRTEITDAGGILFDRSHLHQVLWNVLGNALRHSRREAGSVILRVSQGRRANAAILEIHVIDDGEGVADDLREHIFEPFFTTHSRGTGLGLYIARELCEANRARLELLGNLPGAHFCIKGEMIGDSQS